MITMSANPQQRIGDKKKKEMFKSLVQDAIGVCCLLIHLKS